MEQEFEQIYGFNPPSEMSESGIEKAIELSKEYNNTLEQLEYNFLTYGQRSQFINKKPVNGFYTFNYPVENLYMRRDINQNVKFNTDLANLFLNGDTSPFEICHFEKINVLFVSTNVPIKYLKFPKKRNQIIVQVDDTSKHVILAKKYPLTTTAYTINPKFTFKEYSSIEDCQTEKFVVTINIVKIFKKAKKEGYTELLTFLLDHVFAEC